MVIHYLWIKDFLSLKEKGVNFSSKYFITFETTSVDLNVTGTLHIKHNPNYIPNFFDKPNVKEVTAIIGKNGSGKSTVLEYIKSHFPEGLEANVSSELAVYCLFDGEGRETDFTVAYPAGWSINLEDETGLFRAKEYHNNFSDLGDAFRFATDLSDADYIFYSYNLHYNQDITDWRGLKNISTSALLVEQRKRAAEERWKGGATIEPADAFTNDLQFFTGDEIAKALQLLISEFRKDIPFNPPDYLTVTISKIDRTYFKKHDQFNNDVFEILTKLAEIREADTNDYNKALNDIYIATLLNFFVTERKYSSHSAFENKVKPSAGEGIKDFVLRFFAQIDYTRHPDIILAQEVPRFFDLVEQMIKGGILIPGTVNKSADFYYNLLIKKESTEAFNEFFKLYMRVKGLTNFLDFNWRNLSTGEQSYLSFMARFHHIKRHAIGYDDLKPNLVIMIDEGDVGYHPEWQRTFFKKTLDFLSSLFADHNLQLIFTANAPFITSDLPKSNVVFIEKKPNGAVIVHDKENSQSETFGSNIHTLYSNAFYMEGALIGEFAKNKIDAIIDFLNNKKQKKPNEEYRKTIEIIGEPLIRRKLQSMWGEKFGLDDELQILKKRIEDIKKEKRRKPKK